VTEIFMTQKPSWGGGLLLQFLKSKLPQARHRRSSSCIYWRECDHGIEDQPKSSFNTPNIVRNGLCYIWLYSQLR